MMSELNLKDLCVGQKLYAIPTGNNARYGNSWHVKIFVVCSIGRKYVGLSVEGYSIKDSYCIKTGATQTAINQGYGLNSGYKFFKSLEDLEDYKSKTIRNNKIEKFLRDYNSINKLKE